MKKQTYMKPTTSVVNTQNCSIICTSLNNVNNNAGLKYGGKGSGPARAHRQDIWDDDEE
jgi:hypothetical protein